MLPDYKLPSELCENVVGVGEAKNRHGVSDEAYVGVEGNMAARLSDSSTRKKSHLYPICTQFVPEISRYKKATFVPGNFQVQKFIGYESA
jgi:hypothetical protein